MDAIPAVPLRTLDITDRKEVEKALKREREFSNTLIESLPGLFVLIDERGRLVRWNEGLSALTGLSDDQLQGLDAMSMVVENDRDMAGAKLREVFSRGFADIEFGVRTKSGDVQTIHYTGRIITDEANRPYLVGVGTDVTKQREAERGLRESEERFRAVFDTVNDGIVVHDVDTGAFIEVNLRLCAMFGYPHDEILQLDFGDLSAGVSPYTSEDAIPLLKRAAAGEAVLVEWLCRAKDGRKFWIEVSLRRAEFGGRDVLLSVARDITERKEAEVSLRESEERFRTIFSSVSEGIFISDPNTGRFVEVNPPGCEMFGFTRDEIIGGEIEMLSSSVPPYTQNDAIGLLQKASLVGPQTFEWHCKAKDGRLFWVEMSLRQARVGEKTLMLSIVRDVSGRKKMEEQITWTARHDNLTGLANRGVFIEDLDHAIARARRDAGSFSVLYLDLDHFKDINDTLGHPVGDLLLRAVAERLRASIRETDTVARFGGDEFAVIGSDIREPAEAAIFAAKLLKAISTPFLLQSSYVRSGASIGIAVFGSDSPDAETLLSHADVALYRAKAEARGTYRFFTDAMDLEVRARVTIASELREGIAAGQLFLMYQPQVDVDTGRIVGIEALVRWRHPERGVVLPGEFIPIAEESGQIVAVGHWVLQEACRQMKEWLNSGVAPPLIAVNLSGLQLKNPQELENNIASILVATALPPDRLELEVTESVLMKASHEHNDVLLRIHESGVHISIDDFGNGYSSLECLSRFPIDRIKIAQNFIIDLPTKLHNAMIVKAATHLAQELGHLVVVEGVETKAQLELVRSWGCRQVQGFYFSKPLPAPEMTAALRVGKMVPAHADISAAVAPV